MIGDFRLDQISALSLRTSAMAQLVSSGLLLTKANVNFRSIVVAIGSAGVSGSSAAASSDLIACSDLRPIVPSTQSTLTDRTASMHWPNVWARTATPVGI